jgi:hypothetical protein
MAVRVWVKWLVPSLALVLACGSSKGSGADRDVPQDAGGSSVGAGSTGIGGSGSSKPGVPTGGGASQGPTAGGKSPIFSEGGAGLDPDVGGAPTEITAGAGGAPDAEPGITLITSGDSSVHESYGTLQFQLRLMAEPYADVEVGLKSADTSRAAVFPLKLVFTRENWQKPQSAFVSGVKDLTADGDHQVAIETLPAISSDARYSAIDAADLPVRVLDDTDAGIAVGAVSGDTSESGARATFHVVLLSRPTAKVVLPIFSSDTTEASVPASVTFEPDAWNEPQAVVITGVDDALMDGSQPYKITFGAVVSDDEAYAGRSVSALNLINVDNDSDGARR